MALQLGKQIFFPSGEVNATYDYIDVADGTGVIVFHGFQSKPASGAADYHLSRSTFYSNEIASGGSVTGGTDTKKLDVDFDITFIKPKNMKGTAIVNLPIGINGSAPASSYVAYPVVAIQKVVNGVEQELFALTSGAPVLATSDTFVSRYDTINAELPLTHFKAGETLRLQVQLYVRGNGADTANGLLAFDPQNRTEGSAGQSLKWITGNADLQFHVPFKLEI